MARLNDDRVDRILPTSFIRPEKSRVSEYVTRLTGRTQDEVDRGVPLGRLTKRFVQQGTKPYVWASWGEFDRRHLRDECDLKGAWFPFGDSHINTLFGRESIVSLFQTAGTVAGSEIVSCPEVLAHDLNHDGLCAVTTWRPSGSGRPGRLDAAMGSLPVAEYHDVRPGPTQPYLSGLHWKVLTALWDDPRATASALGRATGLSARTCLRTRNRLLKSRAAWTCATVAEDTAVGQPIFRAFVQGTPQDARVRALLGPDTVITDFVAEGKVWFARAPSVGSIMAAVEAVRRLPMVSDVKLILSRTARSPATASTLGVPNRSWEAEPPLLGQGRAGTEQHNDLYLVGNLAL